MKESINTNQKCGEEFPTQLVIVMGIVNATKYGDVLSVSVLLQPHVCDSVGY